jgi:diguanylate cyclase (GGDEF)-like protein
MRLRPTRDLLPSRDARLESADERDRVAHGRDLAARTRDLAADARDRAMAAIDAVAAQHDSPRRVAGADIVGAAELRTRFALYRAKAATDRARAAADRLSAAEDRESAARDRLRALADRELLARQLADAETDVLTGARTRAAGLVDLERDLDRCHRTNGALTVAYVDVVGLKAVNDSLGHAAGDSLLEDVVACIRAHLRTYDLIVRVGGDEFVCAMTNMTLEDARARFAGVAARDRRDPRRIRAAEARRTGGGAHRASRRGPAQRRRARPARGYRPRATRAR